MSKDMDKKLATELENINDAKKLGNVINDDHEDQINHDVAKDESNLSEFAKLRRKYGINPHVKVKQELLNSDVVLSVRNLKQFFFLLRLFQDVFLDYKYLVLDTFQQE